jgi:hypothetical protein
MAAIIEVVVVLPWPGDGNGDFEAHQLGHLGPANDWDGCS